MAHKKVLQKWSTQRSQNMDPKKQLPEMTHNSFPQTVGFGTQKYLDLNFKTFLNALQARMFSLAQPDHTSHNELANVSHPGKQAFGFLDTCSLGLERNL